MKNVYIRLGIFVSVLALCCVLAWTGLRGRIDSDGGKEGMELIDYDFKKEFDIDVVWVDSNKDYTVQDHEVFHWTKKAEIRYHVEGPKSNHLFILLEVCSGSGYSYKSFDDVEFVKEKDGYTAYSDTGEKVFSIIKRKKMTILLIR